MAEVANSMVGDALTKELSSIKPLKYRTGLFRFDVGPFLVAYAAVACVAISYAIKFDWYMFTLMSYALGLCGLIHILAFLFTHWSMGFKSFAITSKARLGDADVVLVKPAKFAGSMELCPLERRNLREGVDIVEELGFEYRKQRFVYNADTKVFEKLKFPSQEAFGFYQKATGHGTERRAMAAFDRYGQNRVDVPVPAFGVLLKEHLLAPFFCFQVFCVFLWMLDEYWVYSLFTLFMLVTFECTIVGQRQRNLRELRTLQTPRQEVLVYRSGKWDSLSGDGLLPGDIISIGRPQESTKKEGEKGSVAEEKVVPADVLLLSGSCIVEEAVLTGESTPQWKVPITDLDSSEILDSKLHKSHILFSGTKVLQHTGDKEGKIRTPDGGCAAYVLRTGFETAQGRLMRTILFSTDRVTANNMEAGVFILFLMVFAVAAAYYVLTNGLADPSRDRFKLVLNCVMIITSVIPPELPMELSMAVNASLLALSRKKVFCTEPFRIPFGGKVEVCCFDKTGTLTSDHLLLEDVVGEKENHEIVMATCHSLIKINEDIVGDPLEKASIQAVDWSFSDDKATNFDKSKKATILHRHHFNSNLKRMSAIVRVEQGKEPSQLWAVLKGAPEMVKQFLGTVPHDYDSLYKSYASQGARIIALAYKELDPNMDPSTIRTLTRDDVEKDLKWAGFAVFSCPLKEDSEGALKELKDSNHQLVMITGDAPLTACFAASKVHIVTRDVLVLSHKKEEKGHAHGIDKVEKLLERDDEYHWVSPDEAMVEPFRRSFGDLVELASRFDLAISGDALAFVEKVGLASKVIPLCQVFARVSPEQKELVLLTLRAQGRTTLMVGDGTNDVGGLKAAHVGVALLTETDTAEKARHRKLKNDAKKAINDLAEGKAPSAAITAAVQAAEKSSAKGSKKDKSKALPPAEGGLVLPPMPEAPEGGPPIPPIPSIPPVPAPPPPFGLKALMDRPKNKKPGEELLEKLRASGKPVNPAMEKMAKWMDEMDAGLAGGDMPMLKPGDASMAAPFTAKSTSVVPCCDIIKQGRCTLVTTVQMFKILGLLCLSTAFALSFMYLEGVKLSDVQATVNGMMTAGMFFFISQAKPLDKLSPVRPHPTIFSLYFFLSLLGQFAVHLSVLMYMYSLAMAEMPSEQRLGSESEFKPNLVNSVCYLVEAIVQLSTFTVNYVGHPFNSSIQENKGMFTCVKTMGIFLAVVILDFIPGLAESFGLVELPWHIRSRLVVLGILLFVVNFTIEHSLRELFPAFCPPEKGYMMYKKELATSSRKKTQ